MKQIYTNLLGSASLAYAELLDNALAREITNKTGFSFTAKNIKGRPYWYLQHTLGASRKQYYLGEESETLLDRINEQKARWDEDRLDQMAMERLVSMTVAAGCIPINHRAYKVLGAVAQSGLFRAGGVLVGSYAFLAMGNMLGVSWRRDTTITQDIDIAGSPECMVAIPEGIEPLKETILSAEDTLLEVPMFNRKSPSTSFKIRGSDFRVDLITPMDSENEGVRHVAPIKAYAQPARFLDYILEDTQKTVLLHKEGVVVNVPNPARFALHKLVVAERRSVVDAAKARKDRLQASQLLACILDQRPGDLWLAMEAAIDYGSKKFLQQMRVGMDKLGREAEPADANDDGIKGDAFADLVQIFDKLDSGHKGNLARKKTRSKRGSDD